MGYLLPIIGKVTKAGFYSLRSMLLVWLVLSLFLSACSNKIGAFGEVDSAYIDADQVSLTSFNYNEEHNVSAAGAGGGNGGGDGNRDYLDRTWPEPGEDAMPLEPQSPIDDGLPHNIGPWGPVLWQEVVPAPGGGTTTVKRLSSSDPFTATYQLEDGTILVTNRDLSQGIPDPNDTTEPPSVLWTGPDNITREAYRAQMIAYFYDTVTQNQIEQFVIAHNLQIIMSWFEPPEVSQNGNSIAWFQFKYDETEFPTMDDAYEFFTSQQIISAAWPVFKEESTNSYRFVTSPNDYYYGEDENSYVNILGVDNCNTVSPGPENGCWFSDQYVVVIDNGVWRNHPDFSVNQGPWSGHKKITWVGVNCTADCYWVGNGYGEPNVMDPNRSLLATHGTGVAGMITATTNNSIGVASLAPSHAVMPIRLKVSYSWNGQYWQDHNDGSSETKAIRALRFNLHMGSGPDVIGLSI